MANRHEWKYCSLGGVTRIKIETGEDIAHLGELDQKLWTVLSCPIDGLEFNKEALHLIDTDSDGIIHVEEVVETAEYLTSVIKNNDLILNGDSLLPLSEINTQNEIGAKLLSSAQHILKSLGVDANEITLEQASDSKAIFAGTKFNGDGIITEASTDEPNLKATIADIISCSPELLDRSGDKGVSATSVESFYNLCNDYSKWKAMEEEKSIMVYGDNTQSLLDTTAALKEKIEDFFTRCRLLNFDTKTAEAVTVAVSSISEIGNCPLALPNPDGKLHIKGVNPVWNNQVGKMVSLAPQLSNKEFITEDDWNSVCASLEPYKAWIGAKAGAAVEPLGIERINQIIKEDNKASLLALIEQDKSLEAQSNGIDEVKRLMILYKYFYRFICNYVTFTDFYNRENRASFEVGKLYIDQRCCDLCIRVTDMGKHADMAKLSGMFLLYCSCTSKKCGKKMDIVAIMTDGDISSLIPGKNGVFYDLQGDDWDATITKVVDNPLSIKQAFWSPYKKFWDFCVGLINKSAADKDSKITANLQAKATEAAANPSATGTNIKENKPSFDIAKFAGIFAAIGLALGAIGSFLTGIANGVKENPLSIIYAVAAIMVIISGPSCFIAWSKLRKRNLGPVLNANGWAINSKVLVNILFGGKLTEVAKYPLIKHSSDPYAKKKCSGCKWFIILIIIAGIAFSVYYFFIKKDKATDEVKDVTKEIVMDAPADSLSAPITE